MYNKIIKDQQKALNVFHKAVEGLKEVNKSIKLMRDANAVAMQDARKDISELELAIEKKATANSTLQMNFEKNEEKIDKINELLK